MQTHSDGSVELIMASGDDRMFAAAARVSTGGDVVTLESDNDIYGLLKYLLRHKHMSPFEHGSMTVRVEAPIFVAREWMRHRTMSYSEESARYSEIHDEMWVPADDRPMIQEGKPAHYTLRQGEPDMVTAVQSVISTQHSAAYAAYQSLLSHGVAREVARCVLPVGTFTRFYVSANPRNWLQFLDLRMADNAQQEIRVLANQVAQLFEQKWPLTWSIWSEMRTSPQ